MIAEYIIETLARSTLPTWRHERRVILLIEALCLLAGILAAPTREASLLLAVVAPFALWQTELGRADRSAKARESERAEALRLPKVELACKAAIDQAAKSRQLATAAAPLVALAAAVAGAGGKGAVVAAIVGFGVSVVRWGMVELYGPWRAWYRERVPVRLDVDVVKLYEAAIATTATWLRAEGWPASLEDPAIAARRALRHVFIDCPGCGSGGFSGSGTGYGDVCGECGGQTASWSPSAIATTRVRVNRAVRKGEIVTADDVEEWSAP